MEIKIEFKQRQIPAYHDRNYRSALKAFRSKPRIYIFHKHESIIDNLINRHSRPSEFYRKFVLPEVISQVSKAQGKKITWSNKAGCACGCSPGFIVNDPDSSYDVYVTISDPSEVQKEKENIAQVL